MPAPLPRLRADLDLMPSPLAQQPGVLVRDPFRYSDVTLVIPPLLARCLGCFDGEQDESDLRATLGRLAGQVTVGDAAKRLIAALRDAGFLDDERFAALRDAREREFAARRDRAPAHAGSGYPAERAALMTTLRGYFPTPGTTKGSSTDPPSAPTPVQPVEGAIIGIAAPHVSPEGGRISYGAAYEALPNEGADRIFVVAGTSHYGAPDRFGLTRKPFVTPFGAARTERALVDRLARGAGDAAVLEDYCHAVEHSIEFQVVFLQYVYGPKVRILPILCGPFAEGVRAGRAPEEAEGVARFIGTLGEIAAREGQRLCFVLGVDFAHVGRRYGDRRAVRAYEGPLVTVEERDRVRLDRVAAGDGEGFWDRVCEMGDDDLRWCGSAPLYTFLRAVPQARGQLLAYEHWNIDDASVVSFGAMAFR